MEFKIEPHGSVSLESHDASDLHVVNAARVSFAKRSNFLDGSDKGLVKFLYRNRHATPFEHASFRFHVKAPIFVAREWFRHRWGSFNEQSMRYHVPELEFYLPPDEAIRTQTGKPGAYTFETVTDDGARVKTQLLMNQIYEDAKQTYEYLLEFGIAKELARCVLPVGTYTEFFWTVNARSLLNFLSLRTAPEAQLEIRHFAVAIEEIFKQIMPVTYEAYSENNKIPV